MTTEIDCTASAPARATRATPAAGDSFYVDLPIRWGDMDAQAHLNNVVYFRLMEEARIQMVRGSGVSYPETGSIVVAHASCDFLRSFTYPACVRVTHVITRLGRSSAEFEVRMTRADDPEQQPHARGRTVIVWIDGATGASAAWPPELLAGLASHVTPPALQAPEK